MSRFSISPSKLLFALIMASLVSGLVTCINTAVTFGIGSDFFNRWMQAYGIGMCVATPTIYFLAPLARKWAERIGGPSK